MRMKNFKKGDKVVMHSCMEGNHPSNYGKIWTCDSDSFQRESNLPKDEVPEVVFLEGFSGSFLCEYLQFVKL